MFGTVGTSLVGILLGGVGFAIAKEANTVPGVLFGILIMNLCMIMLYAGNVAPSDRAQLKRFLTGKED